MPLVGRAVLVVAHPGHELRLFGWMERARPCVCVLTDGPDETGRPRLDATIDVLARAGARVGPIFGRLKALRRQEGAVLRGLAGELAEWLIAERVVCVAGDEAEGYDPAHDLCRCVIDAAVARVAALGGLPPVNLDFALAGPPDTGPGAYQLDLDDDAFARKQAAALAHPGLAAEAGGVFRIECLRPVPSNTQGAGRFPLRAA
jgi:hypothetical protein